MNKRRLLISAAVLLLGFTAAYGHAAEKVPFGSAKEYAPYYLTILAAQEKGFWKEQGVELEWVSMRGGGDVLRAAAAGAISMGGVAAAAIIPAMARGVPVVIVSDFKTKTDFSIYVRADSPFKEPKDLRGAKIRVGALGSVSHIYGQVMTKAAGVEKEVKFVAVAGTMEGVAVLKTKAVDAGVHVSFELIPLILAKEVRELAAVADYLPKEWMDLTAFALKDIIKEKPELVRRVVKGMVKAADFVMTNRSWSVEKIKATQGFSEEVARLIFERLDLSRTGKIERKAMENIRNFVIEYEIVPKGTAVPQVDELYITKFTD